VIIVIATDIGIGDVTGDAAVPYVWPGNVSSDDTTVTPTVIMFATTPGNMWRYSTMCGSKSGPNIVLAQPHMTTKERVR
jgi:hypothetical protein